MIDDFVSSLALMTKSMYPSRIQFVFNLISIADIPKCTSDLCRHLVLV